MLILRYPRVDMFEPLQLFHEVYVDISDIAMDPIFSALDKLMDDERSLFRGQGCLTISAVWAGSRSGVMLHDG